MTKTAFITGGTKGIGKAILVKLVENRYKVWTCARNTKDIPGDLKDLVSNGKVELFELDLSVREEVNKFTDKWSEQIDVVINNAGVCGIETLLEGSTIWQKIIDTNLNGPFYLSQGLIRFVSKNDGCIINISSQLGLEGRIGFGAYCAAKHAILGLTKCWASELGPEIRVNAISPGWVKTDMAMADLDKLAEEKNINKDSLYNEICDDLDLKRFIEPDEIAHLVSFLISEHAKGITGQNYLIK